MVPGTALLNYPARGSTSLHGRKPAKAASVSNRQINRRTTGESSFSRRLVADILRNGQMPIRQTSVSTVWDFPIGVVQSVV